MSQRGKTSPVGPRVSVCTEQAQKDRDKDRTGPRSPGRASPPLLQQGGPWELMTTSPVAPGLPLGMLRLSRSGPSLTRGLGRKRDGAPGFGVCFSSGKHQTALAGPHTIVPVQRRVTGAVSARGGISGIRQARPLELGRHRLTSLPPMPRQAAAPGCSGTPSAAAPRFRAHLVTSHPGIHAC